jgi:hypothetical protein
MITDLNVCIIPRVLNHITKDQIFSVINNANIGEIDHIDMISKTNEKGDKFQKVFIHFKKWFETDNAYKTIERLSCGKSINIIYEEPWFWKISAYKKNMYYNNNSI